MRSFEDFLFKVPLGIISRFKIYLYRILGMNIGFGNRFESGRARRVSNISIGNLNAFTKGYMLWPLEEKKKEKSIIIGDNNFFNRNLMIDACSLVEIGNDNLFGPDIYITDSNHTFGFGISVKDAGMQRGIVKIGNNCWIGAKAIILKDVNLGDNCIVAAGSVVTKSFPPHSLIAGVPAKLLVRR